MLDNIAVRHALFAETAFSGALARRVGAMRGDRVFTDVEHVSLRQVTRQACAGRSEFRAAPPRLMVIAADCVPLYAGAPREARDMDIPFSPHIDPGFIDIEDLPHDKTGVALAEADFVVAAGNGVTDFKTFSVLAESLGAAPGASRVVCDAGLMPRDRQVGASGTVLSGTCYLALGIAGAPQHLQGVAGVEHVIAVNTDLHAAMIKRASLAIIADTQKVMPALLARLGSKAPA
jgi:electron transfer flavoprotein alpha subunit